MAEDQIHAEWVLQQELIQSKVIPLDTLEWQQMRIMSYVGGLDLSFIKGEDDMACLALVVCQLPELNIVYKEVTLVTLNVPYIPGFLAFREAPAYVSAIQRLLESHPSLVPECFLLDGNGMLHPRSCGLACHVGVMCNIPTIGVAKNLYQMEGLKRDNEHKRKISLLKNVGESFPLQIIPGQTLGLALKTSKASSKPVYISVGQKISLDTAAWLVLQCCQYRVPEPIRQADILSRDFLRKHFPTDQDQSLSESNEI